MEDREVDGIVRESRIQASTEAGAGQGRITLLSLMSEKHSSMLLDMMLERQRSQRAMLDLDERCWPTYPSW